MLHTLTAALVLLSASAASAASLLRSTTPIAGHAAGSFGLKDDTGGQLSGGAAWSADGSTVFTLDTTHELKRWRASDGTLLRGQRLLGANGQSAFSNTKLFLSGVANADGLPLVSQSWEEGEAAMREVVRRYRLNTGTHQRIPMANCAPVLQSQNVQTGLTCTKDGVARAWLAGGEVHWQRGNSVLRLPVPSALQLEPEAFTFGLSEDGRKLALLALRGEDVTFGGAGELLTWVQKAEGIAAQQTALGGPPLHAGASLSWVGERVLVASNVHNSGDEYGSGGSRVGQWLALVDPEHGPVWAIDTEANLRGAYPSPDGELFVTLREGSVPELRRMSDGGFVRTLGAAVHDAAPLSGGRTLLAVQGGAGFGRVVRHSVGELETLFKGAFVPYVLAVNMDGSRIAVAGGRERRDLLLLDSSGRVLREWQARERVRDLAFSPDGQVLSAALGFYGGEMRAWRVLDGTEYPLPDGAQFPVLQVVIREEEDRQNGSYRSRRLGAFNRAGTVEHAVA